MCGWIWVPLQISLDEKANTLNAKNLISKSHISETSEDGKSPSHSINFQSSGWKKKKKGKGKNRGNLYSVLQMMF